MKKLKWMLLISVLTLAGCASLVVSRPNNGYTSGNAVNKDDARITNQINSSLVREPGISSLDVFVSTHQGVVTLRGYVSSQKMINRAMDISSAVSGVKSVRNQLRVK